MRDILNFDRDELGAILESEFNLPGYRAKQLIQWLYRYRVRSFEDMTNISKDLRNKLTEHFRIFRPDLETVQVSRDGSRKFLFRMEDGSLIESVLIKQPTRFTLCISSQVGCAIACQFCRTGKMGLKRHLETREIIGQVLAVQDAIEELKQSENPPEQFQNIVFMGMGEPFHNLDNVIRTVKLLNDEMGVNFSSRKITVSTSGLVPAIREFGNAFSETGGANLAISLNATTDEIRTEVMPINKRWPLEDLIGALKDFPLRSRKRITIEYVMLKGVNDSDADLDRLPKILKGIPVKINLIPYNNNSGLGFESSEESTVNRWQRVLLDRGMNATVRWSKANDISGACGQLATETGRKSKSLPIAA